jgi:hypothetical protein
MVRHHFVKEKWRPAEGAVWIEGVGQKAWERRFSWEKAVGGGGCLWQGDREARKQISEILHGDSRQLAALLTVACLLMGRRSVRKHGCQVFSFEHSRVSGLDLTCFWSEKFHKNMDMVMGCGGGSSMCSICIYGPR